MIRVTEQIETDYERGIITGGPHDGDIRDRAAS